jgi:hypothetical protein
VERVKEEESERGGKRRTKEEKRKAETKKKAKKRRPKTRRPRRGKRRERVRECVDKGEKGAQNLGLFRANREGERERQDKEEKRRRLSRFPFPISSSYSSPNALGQQKNAQKPKAKSAKKSQKSWADRATRLA